MLLALTSALMMISTTFGFQQHFASIRSNSIQQKRPSSSIIVQNLAAIDDEAGSYDPSKKQSDLTEQEQFDAANELLLSSSSSKTTIELPSEIENSFMQYALSIILGRALPDARDGLKPVHRRILFAMNGLNLTPSGGYRKCARVVGEVLGKLYVFICFLSLDIILYRESINAQLLSFLLFLFFCSVNVQSSTW
jgi:hypothetical protein